MYNAHVELYFANLNGLSPGWAAAGAALALGVFALHMYRRRSARAVVHPAASIVLQELAGTRRPRRARSAPLVALARALAVLLVALAFDGLSWGDAEEGGRLPAERVAIVLDGSASMLRVDEHASLFALAQHSALEIAGRAAGAGAEVAILHAAAEATVPPVYMRDLDRLRDRVLGLAPSPTSGPAIDEAVRTARASGADAVYVVSDGQHSIPAPAKLVRVGGVSISGAGIVGLEVTPSAPLAGEPMRVRVQVRGEPGTEHVVEVRCAGHEDRSRTRLDAEGVGWVEVEAGPLRSAGPVELVAALGEDASPWNNEARATIGVRARYRVGLIGESHSSWGLAIEPAGVPTRFEAIRDPEIDALLDFDMIVIAGVRAPDVRTIDALREASRRGVPLIVQIDCSDAQSKHEWVAQLGVQLQVEHASGRVAMAARLGLDSFRPLRESGLLDEAAVSCGLVPVETGVRLIDAGGAAVVQRVGGVYLTTLDDAGMGPVSWPVFVHELLAYAAAESERPVSVRMLDPRESAPVPEADDEAGVVDVFGAGARAFPLTPWLVAAALLILAVEPWLGRSGGGGR